MTAGGRVENDLRRAVILLEPHDGGVGKVVLEVEDVPQVGAAPLVDRLIGIAHDAQVAVVFREPPDRAGIAAGSCPDTRPPSRNETAGVARAHARVILEEIDGLEQEIVEIERVARVERCRIAGVAA